LGKIGREIRITRDPIQDAIDPMKKSAKQNHELIVERIRLFLQLVSPLSCRATGHSWSRKGTESRSVL
jgi:hypothetical protein